MYFYDYRGTNIIHENHMFVKANRRVNVKKENLKDLLIFKKKTRVIKN